MDKAVELAPEIVAFFSPSELHAFAWRPIKIVFTEVKYVTSSLKSTIPQDQLYNYELSHVDISTAIRLLMIKPEILESTPIFRRRGLILIKSNPHQPRITFDFVNGKMRLHPDHSGSSVVSSNDFAVFQEPLFSPR